MASANGLWGLVGLFFPALTEEEGGLCFFVSRFFMASIPARPRRTRRVALCSCLRSTSSKMCSPCRTFPCLTMFRRDIRRSFFLTVLGVHGGDKVDEADEDDDDDEEDDEEEEEGEEEDEEEEPGL